MISGNNVYVSMKKEASWGAAPETGTSSNFVKISSESLKPVYNKISEGLATGSKGAGYMATMGSCVEGSISTLMRPNMGYFLAYALGAEDAVADGIHTIKAAGVGTSLPSNQIFVRKISGSYTYFTGCVINRLNLSAQAGDYLKLDADFVGKEEKTTTGSSTPSFSALRAFKFAQGKVYLAGTEVADVKSVSLEYNNNLDYQTQTTSTGSFYKEPSPGVREINSNMDVVYSADAESLRASYYKTDATFSLKLEFISDEVYATNKPYKLTITIPCNQMSDSGANMSSPTESLSQSMSISAVDNGSDEFITIELENGDTAEYI